MTTQAHAHTKTRTHKKRRDQRGPVGRVTDAAEKIHRSVAGFPLDLLEQLDALAKPVGRIRKLQDRSITATYEMVRGIQAEVERLARAERVERRRAARPKARRAQQKPRAESAHATAAAG